MRWAAPDPPPPLGIVWPPGYPRGNRSITAETSPVRSRHDGGIRVPTSGAVMTCTLSLVGGSTIDEASPRYRGWRVAAVCFAMATFCWGFGFYGHGFYLAELQRLHHWPAALISGASTAYYFVSAILVVFVNDIIARTGLRVFVLAGVAALAASAKLITVISAPWQLFAAYLVMSFGWAAMSVGAITN